MEIISTFYSGEEQVGINPCTDAQEGVKSVGLSPHRRRLHRRSISKTFFIAKPLLLKLSIDMILVIFQIPFLTSPEIVSISNILLHWLLILRRRGEWVHQFSCRV